MYVINSTQSHASISSFGNGMNESFDTVEPTLPVPQMPQYMMASSQPQLPHDEPPSYRTAANYYQGPPPPVAPGYEHQYYYQHGGSGGQPVPQQQTHGETGYGTNPYPPL